ncbi:hypothetical protein, partial [Pseudoalteromonas sp. SIMBA_162]|uniref:hypothetical protein n=1 Tax=Pseudoalteromonas sp. SIMBA_162 TaxID=3080867 RepID=UPI00397E6C1D
FCATAVLGEQAPPKETVISSDTVSKLFTLFSKMPIQEDLTLQLSINFMSTLFIILAALFLAMTIFSFVKKAPVLFSLFMSVLLVVCLYFSFMVSVV